MVLLVALVLVGVGWCCLALVACVGGVCGFGAVGGVSGVGVVVGGGCGSGGGGAGASAGAALVNNFGAQVYTMQAATWLATSSLLDWQLQ